MWLTSVMKNMDVAVFNTIVNVLNLGSVGNAYLGTLTNAGVGLAPYHDNESLVPAELTAAIGRLRRTSSPPAASLPSWLRRRSSRRSFYD